jgi:serine/threonine protein kinase
MRLQDQHGEFIEPDREPRNAPDREKNRKKRAKKKNIDEEKLKKMLKVESKPRTRSRSRSRDDGAKKTRKSPRQKRRSSTAGKGKKSSSSSSSSSKKSQEKLKTTTVVGELAAMNAQHVVCKSWRLCKKVSSGNQGSIWLAEHVKNVGRFCAVKESDRTESAERELDILRRVQHPNVVRLFEAQLSTSRIMLVMSYAPLTLLDLVLHGSNGHMSEDLARHYLLQILSAIRHVHSCGFVHKDIKLESMSRHIERTREREREREKRRKTNTSEIVFIDILVSEDKSTCYLADFGFSRRYSSADKMIDQAGSIHYAAPEIWHGLPYYGPEVDVWAFGVTLYMMTIGLFPFGGKTPAQVFDEIESRRIWFPSHTSKQLNNLLLSMMAYRSHARITADAIYDHPWITKASRFARERADRLVPRRKLAAGGDDSDGSPGSARRHTSLRVRGRSLAPNHARQPLALSTSNPSISASSLDDSLLDDSSLDSSFSSCAASSNADSGGNAPHPRALDDSVSSESASAATSSASSERHYREMQESHGLSKSPAGTVSHSSSGGEPAADSETAAATALLADDMLIKTTSRTQRWLRRRRNSTVPSAVLFDAAAAAAATDAIDASTPPSPADSLLGNTLSLSESALSPRNVAAAAARRARGEESQPAPDDDDSEEHIQSHSCESISK